MIIFELSKDDVEFADKIANEAEMSTIIVEPKSFSSEINDIIQIGVQLAPYAIPAVALILVEMIKNSKKIKIKISDNSFEAEGREKEVLELAKQYVKLNQDEKAKSVLQEVLQQDGGTKR